MIQFDLIQKDATLPILKKPKLFLREKTGQIHIWLIFMFKVTISKIYGVQCHPSITGHTMLSPFPILVL